jgi:hypothetical protein
MVLIKTSKTAEGIVYVFSHYQDAYKKAQRIQAKTGYIQSAQRTAEGFAVLEPSTTQKIPNRMDIQQQQDFQQPSAAFPPEQQQFESPENLGYETPPRLPPGLYDGKW